MECKLCKNDFEKLARSHIFPKGFFRELPEKAKVKTYSVHERGRILQSALIDRQILCHDCERITSTLDDYAIKIFRDRSNSFILAPKLENCAVIVFEDIDHKKLRAFIASMLWRVSASSQREIKNITVGDYYFNKIGNDLLNYSDFNYIDVLVAFLTSKKHFAFMTPVRKRIKPLDLKRDFQNVNGWQFEMPSLLFQISLDQRKNPLCHYLKVGPQSSGKSETIEITSSLQGYKHDYEYFMCFEVDEISSMIENLSRVISAINISNK